MKSLEFYVPLVFQIEGSHLVDSLPYIDEYTKSDEKLVKELIEQEFQHMPKDKDYIGSLNTYFKDLSPVEGFTPMELIVNKPEADLEYIGAVKRNEILIEHLEAKKLNLELLSEFSKECWTKHIETLEAYEKKIDSDTAKLEAENLAFNKSRKATQEQASCKLKSLDNEWRMLLGKNAAINRKLREKQEYLGSLMPNKE